MQEFSITIHCFKDILDFVDLAQRQPFGIMAGNASQLVSAKSHMGMCSLDCFRPVWIRTECSEAEYAAFRQAAKRFLCP